MVDLSSSLPIHYPARVGTSLEDKVVAVRPYTQADADYFTRVYSIDNKPHLGQFVTKGWSPSLQELLLRFGEGFQESQEYVTAKEQRHENTVERNKERYFFVITEDERSVGYFSALAEMRDHPGRISFMIGEPQDTGKKIATQTVKYCLKLLAAQTPLPYFDGKVQPNNNASLHVMRKVFGQDAEKILEIEHEFKQIDGSTEVRKVPRHHFFRSAEYFKK